MRLNKRFYTFIIATDADARVRRLSLSYPVLMAIGSFALVGMIATGVASYRLGHVIVKAQEYDHLLAENDLFRAENRRFGIQATILGEKIDFLEMLAGKVAMFSGINVGRTSSVGLAPRGSARQLLSPPEPVLSSFDRFNRSVTDLELRLRGMSEIFVGKVLLASAVPDRLPVRGYVTAGVGPREDPFNESVTEHHRGLDITAPYGSPVRAPADGVVIFAGWRRGYGNMVVINHRFGTITRYGHLSRMNVRTGQKVIRSDVIGFVGTSGRATGPHLHYEVWKYNVPTDPKRFISHLSTE